MITTLCFDTVPSAKLGTYEFSYTSQPASPRKITNVFLSWAGIILICSHCQHFTVLEIELISSCYGRMIYSDSFICEALLPCYFNHRIPTLSLIVPTNKSHIFAIPIILTFLILLYHRWIRLQRMTIINKVTQKNSFCLALQTILGWNSLSSSFYW